VFAFLARPRGNAVDIVPVPRNVRDDLVFVFADFLLSFHCLVSPFLIFELDFSCYSNASFFLGFTSLSKIKRRSGSK